MSEPSWVATEFRDVRLGDQRRVARLQAMAQQRAQAPLAAFGACFGGAAGAKAGYRWYGTAAITPAAIQTGHQAATIARVQAAMGDIVLAVQDTTAISVNSRMTDAGYLSALNQPGVWLHTTLALSVEREPYGVLAQEQWVRALADFPLGETRQTRPTAEKESQKWLTSLDAAAALQRVLPTKTVVGVGDREADVYDLFVAGQQAGVKLLVRAAQDRRVTETDTEAAPLQRLWGTMAAQVVAGEGTVEIPARPGQAARTAHLTVRFAAVTLHPPRGRAAAEKLPPCAVWAVLAREERPPAGQAPLEWLLLTTVPVTSFADACERLAWYGVRWVVEMYHKILKSGCRIEERQFETVANFQRYLAVDAVVAWRVLYLTLTSRTQPELPCDVLLEAHEWQALYCFIHKTTTPTTHPPTLREAVRWIAQLGGFLGRKGDQHPGSLTLWRGLQRLADIAATWQIFRPPPHKSSG